MTVWPGTQNISFRYVSFDPGSVGRSLLYEMQRGPFCLEPTQSFFYSKLWNGRYNYLKKQFPTQYVSRMQNGQFKGEERESGRRKTTLLKLTVRRTFCERKKNYRKMSHAQYEFPAKQQSYKKKFLPLSKCVPVVDVSHFGPAAISHLPASVWLENRSEKSQPRRCFFFGKILPRQKTCKCRQIERKRSNESLTASFRNLLRKKRGSRQTTKDTQQHGKLAIFKCSMKRGACEINTLTVDWCSSLFVWFKVGEGLLF